MQAYKRGRHSSGRFACAAALACAAVFALGATPSTARAEIFAPGTPIADHFVLGPTSPGNWGGPGAVVTYSFADTDGYADGGEGFGTIVGLDTFMPVGYIAEIEAAFAAWEAVAGITFVEVADSDTPWNSAGATGDIRIGGHAFDGPGGTLAHGYFPPVNGLSAAGDIHFDTAETWKIGFGGPGFDIFQVAAHEIGHAIGLGHQSPPPVALMNPFYTEAFSGPQADDIAGAQALYGPAQQTDGLPEPSTMVLVVCGMASLVLRRRRRA